jgi:glycosyltransferase involved in cell wall biosynthesis
VPYDVFHVNQPHCYLAAKDHRRFRRPGVFIHRSHGLELRFNEAIEHWRRQWHEPEAKGLVRSLASRVVRNLLERHFYLAARYCDGTVVSSTGSHTFLTTRLGVAPERIGAIPQAVPDSYLSHPALDLDRDRLQRVLHVGELEFCKAPRLVAETFRSLAQRFPQARFTWVCGEARHDRARAMLGDLAGRCEFLPWRSQDDLRAIYDAHGIFIFPSLFEGFGKVFLEAMARGLCVVGSDEGGMPDIIRHGENGYLVPVGDGRQLTERVAMLLQDFDTAARVARSARATAQGYTWDVFASRLVAFYRSLIRLQEPERQRHNAPAQRS